MFHAAVQDAEPRYAYTKDAPFAITFRSSKSFILTTISISLFSDSFLYGIVVPVLPFLLASRCNVEQDNQQLWTSALFAAFGGAILLGSPICGFYADHSASRRLPLLCGMPVLALASVLMALSRNVWTLLASRIIQGLTTAVTWTICLSLTRDEASKDQVGAWMGVALTSSSIGLIVSPLLGGILFKQLGIWGVLAVVLSLILLNFIAVAFMIESRRAQAFIIFTRTEAYGTFSDSSDSVDKRIKNSSTTSDRESLLQVHDNWDVRSHHIHESPQSGLALLLQSPRVLANTFGVFTQFSMLAAFDSFLPLFVQRRFHWDALGAGLIFIALAVPALTGVFVGQMSDKFGPRRIALTGCILTAPALFSIRYVGYDSKEQIVLLCSLLSLTGLFLTFIISPLAADLSFAVDAIEEATPGAFGEKGAYGLVYSIFNCAMAAACVAGPVVAGTLQDTFGAPVLVVVMAAWCLVAAVPIALFTGDGPVQYAATEEDAGRRSSVFSRPPSIMHVR